MQDNLLLKGIDWMRFVMDEMRSGNRLGGTSKEESGASLRVVKEE